jgi:hypothetical protein
VPAAAVIPAPIAYIKVVAVKKLVVGFLGGCQCPLLRVQRRPSILLLTFLVFSYWSRAQILYLEKIRVFQAGLRRNTLAWNNRIGL